MELMTESLVSVWHSLWKPGVSKGSLDAYIQSLKSYCRGGIQLWTQISKCKCLQFRCLYVSQVSKLLFILNRDLVRTVSEGLEI